MKCDKCGYSDNGSGDWAHACGPVALQRAPVMNERIKELAEQAGLRFTQLMSNPMVPIVDGKETDLEKFAELIVRECVGIIAKRKDQAIDDGCNVDEAMSVAEMDLLEHFGVEE
jgi:hypothetical protein